MTTGGTGSSLASSTLMLIAHRIVERLRTGPETKESLASILGVSQVSVQRALNWLRQQGAPVSYECRMWRLELGREGFHIDWGKVFAAGVLRTRYPSSDISRYWR